MKLVVNKPQRYAKMRAHTGVHLLYGALEKVTGRKDIKQAGSYVDEDYGRLDFNADKPLTQEQLEQIENLVNDWIYQAIDVEIFETTLDDAISKGAKAFFDEKYWEKVRVINIPGADIELCGWTHSPNTSFVGAFKIISQEAVASGIKRLVILTGPKVAKYAQEKEKYIYQIAEKLDCAPAQIVQKAEKLEKELQQSKDELKNLKSSMLKSNLEKLQPQKGQFAYIINADNFEGVDFKTVVQTARNLLNGSMIIYNKNGNFAIISDGSFSAKEFAKEKWLKWGGPDAIVQWRDEKILEIVNG